MKIKVLVIALVLSAFSLSAFAKVDCSDPKNRPRYIGGTLIGGKKSVLLIVARRSVLNVSLI